MKKLLVLIFFFTFQISVYAVFDMTLLDWHLKQYPMMKAQDVYKLINQSLKGPGHLITNTETAIQYLQEEMNQDLPPAPTPLELISSDLPLYRLYLSSYKKCNLPAKMLVETMITSAQYYANQDITDDTFSATLLNVISHLKTKGNIDSAKELEQIRLQLLPIHFPAIHHSQDYKLHYRPAYRVVLSNHLNPEIIACLSN